MRFGIMEMQLDRLIPSGDSSQNLVDTILNFDRGSLITHLASAGFKTIELGGDLSLFFPSSYQSANIQRLLKLKNDLSLSYSLHLPLWSVEPSTPLEPVRLGSVDALIEVMEAVEPLEPICYVLHATGALAAEFYRMALPPDVKSLALKQFQGGAIRSIQMVLEETGISPRKLAVETIEFPLDLTLEIADLLDLSICLDTGHVLAGFSGAVSLDDALSKCSPRLAEIHLHDTPDYLKTNQLGYGKDHQELGKGDLDVKRFFEHLDDNGFDGPIVFELSVREAQNSLQYLREMGVVC